MRPISILKKPSEEIFKKPGGENPRPVRIFLHRAYARFFFYTYFR